ncbi:MAG TPA: dihydrofolate reductase family protein [Candidatus Saccharimonadales bacterium]|nr:dihydrofolate reductase family protein [Candidatus Saccharimonadales bacterium]
MRKIVAFTMITLDGVIQSPGGPKEDDSNGFSYGGWAAPYQDGSLADIIDKEVSEPFDLLLGAKTYTIFKHYWPNASGAIADGFNKATKYVVSDKSLEPTWKNSVLIDDDVIAKLTALKEEDGPMLQVWGSANLIQTLLRNDLIDELRLRIFPVTIGAGKRLFAEGTKPAAFELIEAGALSNGIIIANYKRAGKLITGEIR